MDCDCLILGGGVIGLSLAYDLVRHGQTVCVLDRGEIGREASWAGAGMLPPANAETALHPLARLHALSHELHPQWARDLQAETGQETGFHVCGAIYLARTPGEAAALVGYAEGLREERVRVERLDAWQLQQIEPGVAGASASGGEPGVRAAYLLPDEAQLRNPWHLRALAEACRRRGVRICEHQAAERFVCQGRRLVEVLTAGGSLRAGSVCLAAGAWTGQLLCRLDVATGILPVRGQMVLLRAPAPPIQHILNEGPRYLVPRRDGRVLVGSTEEEVGFNKENTDEAIDELRRMAAELVPALADLEMEACWAGLRPGTYDGFPYLGRVPGLDNAYVAAGHFRSGLTLSTGTAVVLSRLIRGEDPQLDLSPFHVGRG